MSEDPHNQNGVALSALLHESRRFPPSSEFSAQANAQKGIVEAAAADPLSWWAEQAKSLKWETPWESVLDWQPPFARWFLGGRLNASVNCVDRHVEAGRGE